MRIQSKQSNLCCRKYERPTGKLDGRHYTVTVYTNNCKHAKIKIKAVGVIPHLDCLHPYDENFNNTGKGLALIVRIWVDFNVTQFAET